MSFAEQLTRLRDFLDADDLHEEALDYVAAHGYLTALSICPEEVPNASGSTPSSPSRRSIATPPSRRRSSAPWCSSRRISYACWAVTKSWTCPAT